jgi:hypothetical protein
MNKKFGNIRNEKEREMERVGTTNILPGVFHFSVVFEAEIHSHHRAVDIAIVLKSPVLKLDLNFLEILSGIVFSQLEHNAFVKGEWKFVSLLFNSSHHLENE